MASIKATLILAVCAMLACSVTAKASSLSKSRFLLAEHSAEEKAQECFDLWNEALATKDPAVVTARYMHDGEYGVLVPTLSNVVRSTEEGINDYFVEFLAKDPIGEITELYASEHDGYTFASGLYDFTLTTDGVTSVTPARFTYVFDDECMIVKHHSSQMPEPVA
ncbi:hypothetical protein Ndes2526B_g05964 [Nannochloris sp. 'desiccata']|nr:hypothetical protein KSW81_007771 [Chlorella desiccata (nom. nud.)]KAH7619014.1 hypothetical protein NADE_005862 [Chlorella desiccata (nom. nud.)]